MRFLSPSFAAITILALAGTSAMATTNPFTETFDASSSNWSSAAALTPLAFSSTGGVGNSGFASSSAVTFTGQAVGAQPILIRGQTNFNSSGNAPFGNWITDGVAHLSIAVRQNTSFPVTYFIRFAPAAGPGAVALITTPVQPNTWTDLNVDINASTPFIYEGTTFATAFADVSRVQVGVLVDANIAGLAGPFAFDVDNVAITPAPGALALLGIGGLVAGRRRR